MVELLTILMFVGLCLGLLTGFPVAFVLAGISLIFAGIGSLLGVFDPSYLTALPSRIHGIMLNDLLLAVPLFIFMGTMLEKSRIAERLLTAMARLFGGKPGGLGIAVVLVGAILAASTGIVGATVVTMGLIALPAMLKSKYSPRIATGAICASGTLGQIIPPSIVLILLGDQISSAWQTAQMKLGNMSPTPVSVADLFTGAIVPGIGLVLLYVLFLWFYSLYRPKSMPPMRKIRSLTLRQLFWVLVPPLVLIIVVLGSILAGLATATESAAIGAFGAMVLASVQKKLTRRNLTYVVRETTKNTCMVFAILIGAAFFTVVFRGIGGDDVVHHALTNLPGGLFMAMFVVMLAMFLLGFFLDFIEIIFVVVPIVSPVLLLLGADPVWLAIMMAVMLQTSFLTPPFGFALFYLRGVAPAHVKTIDIYRGVIPFIALQLLMLCFIAAYPKLATWLPETLYGTNFKTVAPAMEGSLSIHTIDF